jgi:competence protein ComEC
MLLWRFTRERIAAVCVLIATAAVFGAWHHLRWSLFPENELGRYATPLAQPIALEAIAAGAPQDLPAPAYDPMTSIPVGPRSRLIVDATSLRVGDTWQEVSGCAQVNVQGKLLEVHAGDRLRIYGDLMSPWSAANPGEFDTALFDRSNREMSIVRVKFPECVTVIEAGSVWNPKRWLDDVRRNGRDLLAKYVSPSREGLASAVLLGQREQVDRETNEAFLETGTIHILCIAGLHMGILAWMLMLVLGAGWLPRRVAIVSVMAVTFAYMLLTTAQPPVVRATLLTWIVCGGMLLGRARMGFNSLALAGLVVLAVNPAGLFHTGVQLSFLSVAVLICAGRWLEQKEELDPLDRLIASTRPWYEQRWRRFAEGTRELFLVGAVMWVAIAPLTMARFHLLTPAALVLNVLLMPVITLTMTAGFGVLVFGFWLTPVAAVFGWLCNWGLGVMDATVKWFSHLPGARIWVAGPGVVWLAIFYLILIAILVVPRWFPSKKWRTALFCGWCGLGLLGAAPLQHSGDPLRCTFVAVGHGGAEVLELPNGKTLLYDAGRLGSPIGGARSISEFLWSRGISHVDAVVLSHADTDHYNALPELLDKFSVGVIYVSPVMFQHDNNALKELKADIERSGTKLEYIYAGDRLNAGSEVKIDVLHPPRDGVLGTDNANCVVLDVEYAGRRILLTGDLEPPGMQMVMNEEPLHCDVLLAPHHGSAHSEPETFVRWTTPSYVIISGALADGHVARTVYEAHGATVLNTADCGAVTVTIDAGRFDVETFRPTPNGQK